MAAVVAALGGLLLLAGAASGASLPADPGLNLSDVPWLALQQALRNVPVFGFAASTYQVVVEAPSAIDHLLFKTAPVTSNAPFMALYGKTQILYYLLLGPLLSLQGYRFLASSSPESRAAAKRGVVFLLAGVVFVPLAPHAIQLLIDIADPLAGVLKPSGVAVGSGAGLVIGGALIGMFDPQSLIQIVLANVLRQNILFLLLSAFPLVYLTSASGSWKGVVYLANLMGSALLVPVGNALALSVSFALMDSGAIDPAVQGPATYYLLLFVPGFLMGSSLVFSFWLVRAYPIPPVGPRLLRRVGEEGRVARRMVLRKRVRDDLRARGLLGGKKRR